MTAWTVRRSRLVHSGDTIHTPKHAAWSAHGRLALTRELAALECRRRGKHEYRDSGVPFVLVCEQCGMQDTVLE